MYSKLLAAAALAASVGVLNVPAIAAASRLCLRTGRRRIEEGRRRGRRRPLAAQAERKAGGGRRHRARTRVDMAPDGMADMESPVAPLPGSEPGVYAFKTDLPMAGRYLLSVAAKVQGEPETVVGKIIFKAVK